VTTVLQQASK